MDQINECRSETSRALPAVAQIESAAQVLAKFDSVDWDRADWCLRASYMHRARQLAVLFAAPTMRAALIEIEALTPVRDAVQAYNRLGDATRIARNAIKAGA